MMGANQTNTYDVIVIGSGISGGWAAKEFCEKGCRTLVLERGRMVEHVKDYPTATLDPWMFPHGDRLPAKFQEENPILSRCHAVGESTRLFFVGDSEHPYIQTKPFDWIRGYQVGGKSLTWGRWTQRWGELDFEANLRDGIAVDWPIRYRDLAPWYSHVEKFAGISGNRDGLAQIPDGEFLPPMEMNCIEEHFRDSLSANFKDRRLVISRTANLSQQHLGRGPCQYRNLCKRGCPFGGYFSSNSATLPAAERTGKLTIRPFSVVQSILYDESRQRAKGVRVIDTRSKSVTDYFARVVFVNAGTLNSTLILLNSTSSRWPEGMGNDSGELGRNLMDHNYNASVTGTYSGLQDKYFFGRRPTGTYIPRFRNWGEDKRADFIRGYAFACFSARPGKREAAGENGGAGMSGIGAAFKEELTEPGDWTLTLQGMGECLPNPDNKVTLSKDRRDEWGMPLLDIDAHFRENEQRMQQDVLASGAEMLDKAGFSNITRVNKDMAMGLSIHEMGTARMGRSPKTSVLNEHNQVWGVRNVFVTDGACMTSGSCQNPSLTYMALTARAVDFAVGEMKKQHF